MNFQILEYDKTRTASIDEFSDLIQKTLNENGDLHSFRPYENPHTGSVFIELIFKKSKTKTTEVMAFGPDRYDFLLDQVSAVLNLAEEQAKEIKFSGMIPMAKSNRSVCFVVLEKGIVNKEDVNAQSCKAEASKQNSTANVRTNRRAKTSA